MDYEKEYKKKLNDARYWHDVSEGDIPAVLEEIFPELRENENEIIKEELINYLKFRCNSTTLSGEERACNKWIDWLKKQGQKPAEWHIEDEQNLNACLGYISDEFLRRWLTDIIYAKCDKSAWSEEDESMYTRTLGILGKCYMGQLPTKVEDELKWFKSLKNKL